ncbi:hypothetical protein L208DRAFT_1392156 [Tricholoma matsutake]|nr:hypothetical protein L208DRAFT_1392156 [Tricholoma matsutake 945]
MNFFNRARGVHVSGGQFISVGRDIQINYANSLSIFDILKEHMALNTAYNSREHESEHASICQEGTREDVLRKISAWCGENTGYLVCWLEGPAGLGKSTIAHTIAKQCDDDNRLAFSFFFSRGKHNCSDTTKFVPLFAYQLAESVPAIQPSMWHALADNPSAPHLGLHDQIEKLIIHPFLTIPGHIQPKIVVIDGLNESRDNDLIQELIQLLVDATNHLPFRFLFTSQPEHHIQQMFETSWVKRNTYLLSLCDFHAHTDVWKYLKWHLAEICEQNDDPSDEELDRLVHQSDGLFIYVSTLVRFIADETDHPQERLQTAMMTHSGVDPLYHQVLSAARKFKFLERVIGTIIYLRHSLTISALGQLLQLQPGLIHLALRGCHSVFVVPDTDQESVHPYHASLRDFLTDCNQVGEHYFDAQVYHVSILVECLQLIENQKGGEHLLYACQNWCHHFSLALSHGATVGSMNAKCDVVMLMMKMEQEWMRLWMYGLEDFYSLDVMCTDCESVVGRMMEMPVQWRDVIGSFNHVLNVVQKVGAVLTWQKIS